MAWESKDAPFFDQTMVKAQEVVAVKVGFGFRELCVFVG